MERFHFPFRRAVAAATNDVKMLQLLEECTLDLVEQIFEYIRRSPAVLADYFADLDAYELEPEEKEWKNVNRQRIFEAIISGSNNSGGSPLHVACAVGAINSVKWLVAKNGVYTLENDEGMDPISMVCSFVRARKVNNKKGYSGIECLKFLLSRPGVRVNNKNDIGWTPLHFAAREGCSESIKLLLEAGADPCAKSTLLTERTVDGRVEILRDSVTPCDVADDPQIKSLLRVAIFQKERGKPIDINAIENPSASADQESEFKPIEAPDANEEKKKKKLEKKREKKKAKRAETRRLKEQGEQHSQDEQTEEVIAEVRTSQETMDEKEKPVEEETTAEEVKTSPPKKQPIQEETTAEEVKTSPPKKQPIQEETTAEEVKTSPPKKPVEKDIAAEMVKSLKRPHEKGEVIEKKNTAEVKTVLKRPGGKDALDSKPKIDLASRELEEVIPSKLVDFAVGRGAFIHRTMDMMDEKQEENATNTVDAPPSDPTTSTVTLRNDDSDAVNVNIPSVGAEKEVLDDANIRSEVDSQNHTPVTSDDDEETPEWAEADVPAEPMPHEFMVAPLAGDTDVVAMAETQQTRFESSTKAAWGSIIPDAVRTSVTYPDPVPRVIPSWDKQVYHVDMNPQWEELSWANRAMERMENVHLEAVASGINCGHVLGLDLDNLSFGQLDSLEEVHRELVARLNDARISLAQRTERARIEEEIRIRREMEELRAHAQLDRRM